MTKKESLAGRPVGRKIESLIAEAFETLVTRGMSPTEAAARLAVRGIDKMPKDGTPWAGKLGLSPDGKCRAVSTIWDYINEDRKKGTLLEVFERNPGRYKNDDGVQRFIAWHYSLVEARQTIPIGERLKEALEEQKRDERNTKRREKYEANKLKLKEKKEK